MKYYIKHTLNYCHDASPGHQCVERQNKAASGSILGWYILMILIPTATLVSNANKQSSLHEQYSDWKDMVNYSS